MSYIPLDPELGVNPKLTYCPRCGGEGKDLILIGSNKGVYECPAGHTMFGRPSERYCPLCACQTSWTKVREIGEHEKLPSTALCDACEKEVAEYKAIVAAGGVYFKCLDCKAEGVVKAEAPLAKHVRETLKEQGPCGVEINKAMGCTRCLELDRMKEGGTDDGRPPGT